ncbi:hypothetical protein [Iodidimonas sp. SYSU 1G8]|uniref:hypothetical protein n=1 Tax=Iodidimonas sp. SYSU 1G8 TaxID=3133967 RepID=UPI0031FF1F0C
MKNALACFVLLMSMAFSGHAAVATPVNWGVPVSGFGATTTVGNYNSATGQIGMYIPLTGGYNGVYGVNGVGMSASTGQAPTSGSMNMFLKFTGVSVGPNILSLAFNDLDIVGANDPNNFFESVQIFTQDGTSLALIDNVNDPWVISAPYEGWQTFEVPLTVASTNTLYVKLGLRADLTQLTGMWENTQEFMKASIAGVATPVSEPVTFGFLGLGMLGLAAIRRRAQGAAAIAA